MRNFRELKVWQKAHPVTLAVYRATQNFPRQEQYGLTAQVRRSALSIGSNIAEGCVKATNADFCRFLNIALGSASELEYQLLLAHDLGYLRSSQHSALEASVQELKRSSRGSSSF
jgi:four helix bundle protein